MALSVPGRTVVFDYGEVISRSPGPEARRALEAVAGIDPVDSDAVAALHDSYARHRDDLDSGALGIVDYWRSVEADTGASWSLSTIHRLWSVDFPAWLSPETGTLDVLAELHEGGTRLAILSNAGFDYAGPLRFSPLGTLFEQVFVSAELHDLKPSATIYEHVLRELGVTPAETIFVDNKRVNVEGAEALGITGHVFTSPGELRAFLVGLAS